MEIPQLLDATDISNGIVDERSINTYLSMIHHAISLKVPSEVLSLPLLLLLSLLLPSSSPLLPNRIFLLFFCHSHHLLPSSWATWIPHSPLLFAFVPFLSSLVLPPNFFPSPSPLFYPFLLPLPCP